MTKLYKWQWKAIQEWKYKNFIGTIKATTGSGKCVERNTYIYTDKQQ